MPQIDIGSFYVTVACHFLYQVYIGACFYHVRKCAVPDQVGVNPFFNTGFFGQLLYHFANTAGGVFQFCFVRLKRIAAACTQNSIAPVMV